MIVVVAAETLLLGVVALFVIALLRSHAEILRRLEQLDRRRRCRNLTSARRISSRPRICKEPRPMEEAGGSFSPGPDTLLAFLSSGCSTCVDLLEALRHDDLPLPQGLRLVVVAKDPRLERLRLFRPLVGRAEVVMSSGCLGRLPRCRGARTSSRSTAHGGSEGRARRGAGARWRA